MKWSHFGAALVAGAGLVALAVSMVRFWPASRSPEHPAEISNPTTAVEPAVLEARYPLSSEEGADAVANSIAESIKDADGGDPAILMSLRDLMRQAIPAYLSENLADFNACLATMGVDPINDGGDPRQWLAYRRCFADARFDPESVTVVCRTRGGHELPLSEQHQSVRTTERPKARPEWAQHPAESYEVRVKGLFHAYAAGSPQFEAMMGLEFARNPTTGEWVLIHSRLYDVPNGVMVVGPPV